MHQKKNEWKMIYLFCLVKLTPVKSLKGESSPIQQMNYVCLGNVFATWIGIQPPMSLTFFCWTKRWNLHMLNILINHKHIISIKQEDFNIIYLITNIQSHWDHLCCVYKEKKAWTGLWALRNKVDFFKDYIAISSFSLHLLIGNVRQERSWFFSSQVSLNINR